MCIGTHTYGSRSLNLAPTFRWIFIVTHLLYLITGIDIPRHFDPLVDARHRKIVSRRTSLTANGSYAVGTNVAPQYDRPLAQQSFSELPFLCPGTLQHTGPIPSVTSKVTHRVAAAGPPKFSRPRRPTPHKLRPANA